MNTPLETQLKQLKKDKKLSKVINHAAVAQVIQRKKDLYLALMRSIVGQQLSVKAASTIWGRFLALFPENYPEIELVLKMKTEALRKAGLSNQKAGYIINIAEYAKTGALEMKRINKMSDEAIIEMLISIKGVGKWTVEMILMFALGRENVFPVDDLGIQMAMIDIYQLEGSKKELQAKMKVIAEKWQPFRTLACLYLWQHKDSKPKR